MAPAIQRDRAFGFEARAVIQPPPDQGRRHLAAFQVQAIPVALIDVLRLGDDGASRRRRIDPGRQRELVVEAEISDRAEVDKTLAVECGRPVLNFQIFGNLPLQLAAATKGLFPLPLRLFDVKLGEFCFGLGDLPIELPQLRLLRRSRRLNERRRIPVLERHAPLRDVIEVGEELIKLFLQDRIVLMVVAARASDRQPQPHRGRGIHAIDHILHRIFLGDDAAFAVAAMIAIEA